MLRRLDLIVAAATFLAAPATADSLQPTTCSPTFAIGGEVSAARKVQARLSADVLVNGRGPYKFIVDTGSDSSAIGLRIAHDLRLPPGRPAILNGMTAREIVDRVKVGELTVGPTTIRNLELPALRELDLGGDGLLAIDTFGKQRLVMDFEKHLITVEDARKPPTSIPSEIVATARRQRGQLILTDFKASGFPVNAAINTGSEITIGNLALRDKLLSKGARIAAVDVVGVSGETVKMQLARIDELQLGPVLLRNVPVAFADAPPFRLLGLSNEPALLLGTDLMSTFRQVSLDFRERKVRFLLRDCH
jgi:hypothetical protein